MLILASSLAPKTLQLYFEHAGEAMPGCPKGLGRAATDLGLELLALIVEIAHNAKIGLVLVLKEGIMQDLVVDVQLAHLRLHPVLLL